MTTQKLLPFDLEAALSGEKFCYNGGEYEIATRLEQVSIWGMVCQYLVVLEDGNAAIYNLQQLNSSFRMLPKEPQKLYVNLFLSGYNEKAKTGFFTGNFYFTREEADENGVTRYACVEVDGTGLETLIANQKAFDEDTVKRGLAAVEAWSKGGSTDIPGITGPLVIEPDKGVY